jgi:hypothetical protein
MRVLHAAESTAVLLLLSESHCAAAELQLRLLQFLLPATVLLLL